jgi:hypothetical protein
MTPHAVTRWAKAEWFLEQTAHLLVSQTGFA